jgi:hypothetical protein
MARETTPIGDDVSSFASLYFNHKKIHQNGGTEKCLISHK